MGPAVPQDPEGLKQLIAGEVGALRAAAARRAGVRREAPAPDAGEPAADEACPCGAGGDRGHGCGDAARGHDPWACVCATLPAIPVSAALLAPVTDDRGRTVDFRIRAGNHVRSSEWLDAPDRHVGERLLDVRPGADGAGLLDALREVLRTGRALKAHPVDYTERRPDGLHRTKLLYDAASCNGHVLATWRPAQQLAELMSLEAQRIAGMGWAHFDLLSGTATWSDGLAAIFRTEPGRPMTLMELCDTVPAEDVPTFGRLLRALFDGEEPPGQDIRFQAHGDIRTLHVLGRPVTDDDAVPWALHLITRDLTAQVRYRDRLARTRRERERLREQVAAERRVASVLREALLPTHSTEIAGLGYAVAAAYLPAEPHAAIGGDWYKCRALPDGRILLAVGDACGHGLGAVARMAQQRHALAGLAHAPGTDAGDLTTWLNELLCADPSAETATTVIGHIDRERRLTWACAGHPPPLLLRGDEATVLDASHRGPLLGMLPGNRYATATLALNTGDLVLLYTDGLVERRDEDITDSIAELRRRLATCSGLGAQETLDSLMTSYEKDQLADDTCLVAVKVLTPTDVVGAPSREAPPTESTLPAYRS
ncbi:PP2C family protein-serine/threonine phosphatase [Streptomyces sp. Isolate_45]|uniref:PP2C family protein-serine/threonine phosphatase n=1 Tax=Streptomyces sp. Isolate_45 TaxID=2950111 RepID=UPI002481A8E6|nr:PP2C family protein-serine/threonine phosphatase [Streptomyces sp. Isolate_45]MDA5282683.1 PP2C family protein-serine/threonine phosphatase [Streptomyces sp. Isolate_45]